jgi:phosphoribosylamine--glycine ligase
MNVMIVGSGAREHAIAWKLRQSQRLGNLYVTPGTAGTARIATNLGIPVLDVERLFRAVRAHSIDLTVVGPETPLAAGIVDRFRHEGLRIFGPTQAAARIESSKVFSKELLLRHGIPTGRAQMFGSAQLAKQALQSLSVPVVVKADGLAAGKGVTVCATTAEAVAAVEDAMERRVFGSAGDRILLEECLAGREVSVFVFTDGEHVSAPVAACDYKRVHDGDRGPNTGGMGGYSPPEFWTPELSHQVMETIVWPTLRAMAQEGCPFQGVLYAGLMLTNNGPKVIEFNCRLGDPETQVLMPRLESDLLDIMEAVVDRRLDRCEVRWSTKAAVGVVLASAGYPGDYTRGLPISGLDAVDDDALVFHAATRSAGDSTTVTDGGRVLTVVGAGATLAEARRKAYANANHIHFDGAHHRTDIAAFGVGALR